MEVCELRGREKEVPVCGRVCGSGQRMSNNVETTNVWGGESVSNQKFEGNK